MTAIELLTGIANTGCASFDESGAVIDTALSMLLELRTPRGHTIMQAYESHQANRGLTNQSTKRNVYLKTKPDGSPIVTLEDLEEARQEKKDKQARSTGKICTYCGGAGHKSFRHKDCTSADAKVWQDKQKNQDAGDQDKP